MSEVEALRIDRGARRGRSRGPRWIGPLLLIVLLIALGWLFQRPILRRIDQLRLPRVHVGRVFSRSASAASGAAGVSANGYVVARTRAALSSDAPGRLVQLDVVEGSVLKKGDVVARLYFDEYEAQLERARADLAQSEAAVLRAESELARARTSLVALEAGRRASTADLEEAEAELVLAQSDHERTQKLVQSGVQSPQRLDEAVRTLGKCRARRQSALAHLDQAQAELESGRAEVSVADAALGEARARVPIAAAARELAEATLEKTYIRAPFDGVVTNKEAEVGEVVSPNSQGGSRARGSVVTMVDLATLEVQSDVPETTLSSIRAGGPARVYLDAFPNDPYPARVGRIWPTADRQKATVEVRVLFERRDEKLRPEMGVRIVFLREESDAPGAAPRDEAVTLVPAKAIVQRDGQERVFVLRQEQLELRSGLELGEAVGDARRVLKGLEVGEEVVLDPAPDLQDGERVLRAEE